MRLVCVQCVANILTILLLFLSSTCTASFNTSDTEPHRPAYPGGLLFQLSQTPVRLIKRTAVLKQTVDFDILARNMDTLNTFRIATFQKLDSFMNTSLDMITIPQHLYKHNPARVTISKLIHGFQQMVNKTNHITKTKIHNFHNTLRTVQQKTMQRIVHAQEQQHTWYNHQSLTIAQQSELHMLSQRTKRSLLLIMAKLGAAVKTITSLSSFSFLPIFQAFSTIPSLLDATRSRFQPKAIKYQATPQLSKIFQITNRFTSPLISRRRQSSSQPDLQLGDYMHTLTGVVRRLGVSGISSLAIENFPTLTNLSLSALQTHRNQQLTSHKARYGKSEKELIAMFTTWSHLEMDIMQHVHQIQATLTEFRMECEETIELARAAYAKAMEEVTEVTRFLDHITQARTMAESDIYKSEWAKLRKEPHVTTEFTASIESQLDRVVPKLKFLAQEYQIHYEVQLIDQHLTFQMYRSKYVPFATTHGTFVLNHMDTIQLIDPVSKDSKTLPREQLHSCQATRDAYYCDQDIVEHDQGHECIQALQTGNAEATLSHCTLAPAKRVNQLVRLTDSIIYFDQLDTPATQRCASSQKFTLSGQGTFYISPSCRLNVVHSSFHSQSKIPYTQSATPIKLIKPLQFNQHLVDTHPQTFPKQIPSYLTVHMAILTHVAEAILLAFAAMVVRYLAKIAKPEPLPPAPEETPFISSPQPQIPRQTQQNETDLNQLDPRADPNHFTRSYSARMPAMPTRHPTLDLPELANPISTPKLNNKSSTSTIPPPMQEMSPNADTYVTMQRRFI